MAELFRVLAAGWSASRYWQVGSLRFAEDLKLSGFVKF